ncbi:Uncharacterised protein [Xylophilus ampelinus]|nr:hypothetical protein [Variovorax sp.]VTY36963.1 Uncharacterised protein [Xylophilus ampelinus]
MTSDHFATPVFDGAQMRRVIELLELMDFAPHEARRQLDRLTRSARPSSTCSPGRSTKWTGCCAPPVPTTRHATRCARSACTRRGAST